MKDYHSIFNKDKPFLLGCQMRVCNENRIFLYFHNYESILNISFEPNFSLKKDIFEMESIGRYSHYIVVTNIARYSYQVLPQMVCRSSNLLNLMTIGSVWYNNCLILTNTDDWLIYAKHLKNQMLKLRD